MASVIPIFPTTLYKAQSSLKLSKAEYDIISKFEGLPSDFGNTQSANGKILDLPGLESLKEECQMHLDTYYRQVTCADDTTKIHLTDSWINFARKGDQHTMHTHVNSVLSGVFYLQVNDSVPAITFHKPEPFLLFDVGVTQQTVHNSPQWRLDVANGDIIIFPSNVWHSVEANPSDQPRVSLAFNSFVDL